ncbi:MAG: hypothetical protein U9P10_14525 [Thermodesulfobacteriota bacterium]|nr:hypothetical protein [Thermodesulfobacteriota bacterium]
MLRIILSFAAGFTLAKLTSDNSIIKKTKKQAADSYRKIKSASQKTAGVIKEEFSSKEEKTGA